MTGLELTIFATAVLFVAGTCIGSFLNALNYRIVEEETFKGRSFCPNCKHTLSWYELLPLVSYLLQKGRCRHCQKKISPRYPLVELSCGVVFALASYLSFTNPIPNPTLFSLQLLFWLVLSAAFVGVAAADLSWGIIPDLLVFPAIGFTALYRIVEPVYKDLSLYYGLKNDSGLGPYLLKTSYFSDIVKSDVGSFFAALVLGLVIAGLFFCLIYFSRGRAMGLGDVKLGFLIGLAVGWPSGLVALFLAFLTGAASSLILILVRKKSFGETVPFGPFLSIGALIALFSGTQILNTYLSLFK